MPRTPALKKLKPWITPKPAEIHGHQATRPMPKPAEAPRRKPLHADSPTGSIPQTRLLPYP
ncbi:MAG: hypothetical protein ACKOX4_11470 [Bacteroidota bacterium]